MILWKITNIQHNIIQNGCALLNRLLIIIEQVSIDSIVNLPLNAHEKTIDNLITNTVIIKSYAITVIVSPSLIGDHYD